MLGGQGMRGIGIAVDQPGEFSMFRLWIRVAECLYNCVIYQI